MVTKIFLTGELGKNYLSDSSNNSLESLGQVNVFIGANNTGKSRFLRALFADQNFRLEISNFDSPSILNAFSSMVEELDEMLGNANYEDVSSQNIPGLKSTLKGHIEKLNQIPLLELNKVVNDVITFWRWVKTFEISGAANKPGIISMGGGLGTPKNIVIKVRDKYEHLLNDLIPQTYNYATERLYIPILRGLRPTQFQEDNKFDEIEDNYLKRTIRDYFNVTNVKNEQIFTGLRLYDDTKKMLLGKREEREKIKSFENFLSKSFFNNQPVTLIPNIEDDSLHVSIGDEEWPIYELGDGIQSIIILLYPLFFNQGKNLIVFIEEPENSMHPGLQRLFIETITQGKFKSFQYFITTHSNHFLDITMDIDRISIYTFNKRKKDSKEKRVYKIENTSNGNVNVLDLIGVRNSSVFLSNCTIWVEGITDRLYLKKFLELYQKELEISGEKIPFKEDYNFSFIEYGGSNLSHWTFGEDSMWEKIKANKISSKVFLVADKDSSDTEPKSAKAKRLKLLKEVLGERIQVIEGREIENLLSLTVIVDTIRALEKENSINVAFDTRQMSNEDRLNSPFGRFISANFTNLKRKYEADSGTLFCKLDFCRVALSNLKTIEDLSQEAIELTKKIYRFIESANFK